MPRDARWPRRRTQSSSDRNGRPPAIRAGSATDIPLPRCACKCRSFPVQSREQLAKSRNHLWGRAHVIRRAHQQVDRAEGFLFQAKRLADAALDPVALGGCRRVLSRYQDSQPRRTPFSPRQVERIACKAAPRSLTQQAFEFAAAPRTALAVQSETLARRGYSPRRRRPRERRLRRTLRPPGVRLRTRKPWRRARRVLDGW